MGQLFDMETIDDGEIEKKPGRPLKPRLALQNPRQPVVVREIRSHGNRTIRIIETTQMVSLDEFFDQNEEPDYWENEY